MNASEINTDRLVADLKTVTRDAEDLLKTVSGERGNGSREIRMRLSAAIESAKETYHRLEEKAVAGAKATDKVIRTHPYESLGVALGVGVLLGYLIRRK
ncbi:MAG TPA: DUF883 family protein [Candidatus Paceibacterota bacterium]|nr:DUF883 family protein [Candidatus Paceibacterota bacterium]